MKNNIILGAWLIMASELSLLFTGMIIKQISESVPLEQIVFLRNIFGLALLMPWLYRKGISRLNTSRFSLHLLRGTVGVTAMVCMFYVWGHLPLAQAALLKQTSPLFIPVIAFFWLKERIGKKTIIALFIGFIGVTLIINPDAKESDFNFAVLLALIGAVLAGVAKVSIRKLSTTEPHGRTVFYFALIGTVLSVIPATLGWVSLTYLQLGYLIGIAFFSTVGQLLLSKAYGLAPAGQLGPYTYTSVIFAAVFGWIIWNETLVINTLLGIVIIISAGILAMKDK